MNATNPPGSGFKDLLEANKNYAAATDTSGFDGMANAGIAVVTCMDSRIEPLRMIGLKLGDAKIFRNPGGRITPAAAEALILAVHLLNVERILIVPHTKCAMSSSTEQQLRERISAHSGTNAAWQGFHVVADQTQALRADLAATRSHPLIAGFATVGGFIYDVDTGLLRQVE